MELVWNNPNPSRTAYRPPMWELIGRDGTTKLVTADEIQVVADRKLGRDVKDVVDRVATPFSAYFCF